MKFCNVAKYQSKLNLNFDDCSNVQSGPVGQTGDFAAIHVVEEFAAVLECVSTLNQAKMDAPATA